MSRIKTNQRTVGEQYTRSNASTARLLYTLVKLAETSARNSSNTKERWEMVTSTVIVEHHLQMKHPNNWDSATCTTYSTDYYQWLTLESWCTCTNLEQTPLNCSQVTGIVQTTFWQNQTRENKWTTDNYIFYLTSNKQLFNCDNRQIERHQWHYESS